MCEVSYSAACVSAQGSGRIKICISAVNKHYCQVPSVNTALGECFECELFTHKTLSTQFEFYILFSKGLFFDSKIFLPHQNLGA